MPRDSQLLTPTSKALLRAARAGCIYIRQAPKEAEDINLIINEEKEAADTEEGGAAAAAAGQPKAERSFVTRKWMTVPRQMEPPEVEFLAKRRPGLPSLYGAAATGVDGAPNVPMRRTRFKKVDPATGNVSVYEAWVPEGHRIEGEITADDQVLPGNAEATVNSEAPAPGTVVEGVGTVNGEGVVVAEAGSAAVMTPPKRRPPPPKRKGKGFKGRRKKVMFAPGEGADASAVHGAGASAREGTMDTDGAKSENGDASRGDQGGHEDDDDDGEEGEESDEGDESMIDAKTPETPAAEFAQPTQTTQPGPAEMAPEPQAPDDASQAAEQAYVPALIPDKPSDEKPVPEDVTMTDYQPESATSEPQPAPDTQKSTAPEQPAPAAETPTENQPQTEQPAFSAPEESSEKPQETDKTEPNQQENQDAMDTSADQPLEQQQPQQEQQQQQEYEQEQEPAPKPELEQQEHNTAATEYHDVDVLGTLEKSLDAPVSSEQAEPLRKPEPEPESRQADDLIENIAPASALAPEPEYTPAATAETGISEEQPSTDNHEVEKPAEEQTEEQSQQQQEEQPPKEEEVEDKSPVQQPIEQSQEQEQQQQPEREQQPTGTPSAEHTEPTEQPAEQPAEQPKEKPDLQPRQQADEAQQQPPAVPAQEGEPGQN